ncbi:MAG: hypothetical protein JOZ13_09120 [Alphaproteobacteria bacterium]|nr:hypothetical protein [Alphaproteobacteria bacterium]
MRPPPDLDAASWKVWTADRDAAIARLDGQKAKAKRLPKPRTNLDAAARHNKDLHDCLFPEEDAERHYAALAAIDRKPPRRESDSTASPLLATPQGNVADLLEQQIGTCTALIGNIAELVANPETSMEASYPFVDRISMLLSSSASAARVVGQLRGIATETKQTFVTRKEGEREGGAPES